MALAPELARVAEQLPGELAERLTAELATIGERWPTAPPASAAFAEFLAARNLAAGHFIDLYLAWWCTTGDPASIAAFEARYDLELRTVTARFRELAEDELRQLLRIKLFVGSPEVAPKILDYTGRGALGAWLRVTAVRSCVDVVRSTRRTRYEKELDEGELLGVDVASPERGAISSQLATAIKQAFAAAVAKLSPRQRVFLRHAYVDRHTLDQIATMYSVHRATVARTLASARDQLISDTRAAVAASAGVSEDELATLIRALDSRLELSLSRVLAP